MTRTGSCSRRPAAARRCPCRYCRPRRAMFSMMNCCPSRSESFCPISRAITSVGPPAGNGTMMRTSLFGIVCANAGACEQRGAQRRDPDDRPHRASSLARVACAANAGAADHSPAICRQGVRLRPKEINYSDPIARRFPPRNRPIPIDALVSAARCRRALDARSLEARRGECMRRFVVALVAVSAAGARFGGAEAPARQRAEGSDPRLDQQVPAQSRSRARAGSRCAA